MIERLSGKQYTDVALATTQRTVHLVTSTVCRSVTALTAIDGRPHLLTPPTFRDGLYRIRNRAGWVTMMKFLFTHPTLAGLQAAAGTARIWGAQDLFSPDVPKPVSGDPITDIICDHLLTLTLTAPAVAIEWDKTTQLISGLGGGERIGLVDTAGLAITTDATRNASARVRSTGVLEFDSGPYPELYLELHNNAGTQGMLALHTNY